MLLQDCMFRQSRQGTLFVPRQTECRGPFEFAGHCSPALPRIKKTALQCLHFLYFIYALSIDEDSDTGMQIMNKIQMPSVAGMFYPADPEQLNTDINDLLQQASANSAPAPKALIAPHAGYVYSGPVAASAYVSLLPQAKTIRRVLLLAPSHRLPFHGLATSSADFFNTPLGDVAVDREAVDQALTLPQVQTYDQAFAGDKNRVVGYGAYVFN